MYDGFVLCGGKSSRMGTDKALIQINGTPMAEIVAEKLKTAGCKNVYLVSKNKNHSDLKFPVLLDQTAEHHPLFGIAAALKKSETAFALISPCDLPFISVETITNLLQQAPPCIYKSQPLFGVFPKMWLERSLAFAYRGSSVYSFADECRMIFGNPIELRNVNYASDLGVVDDHN